MLQKMNFNRRLVLHLVYIIRQRNRRLRRILFLYIHLHSINNTFMLFILFYTANCLHMYIIFLIFLISLHLASRFNVSVIKMLQLLGSFTPDLPTGLRP